MDYATLFTSMLTEYLPALEAERPSKTAAHAAIQNLGVGLKVCPFIFYFILLDDFYPDFDDSGQLL
jgi:hypothetical protein